MKHPATPSISAIILTHNEERNLPHCLEVLKGLCQQIFVVDSGSSDQTTSLAQRQGAHVVQHPFETHAKQWHWALRALPITGEWILALDADQRVSAELKEEICRTLALTPPQVNGYYLPRKQIFKGRWIRHGGYWPKYLLKLFRIRFTRIDERELVDHRFYVQGETRQLHHPLVEQNEKEEEILFWIEKHLRYARLRAQEEYQRRHDDAAWLTPPRFFGTPDQRTLWLKRLWYRLPPLARPFLYFGYRYLLRLGFLDGWTGGLFHFLQSFWYELMVAVRLKELEQSAPSRGGTPSSS